MVDDRAGWRGRARRAALALAIAALTVAWLGVAAVHAQNIMRTPNLNVGVRTPTIGPGPTVGPTIGPTVAPVSAPIARIDPNVARGDLAVRGIDGTGPRYSRNPSRTCNDDECRNRLATSDDRGGKSGKKGTSGPRKDMAQTALSRRPINELVAEIDSSLTDAQTYALARRHGLTRIASQNFPLVGSTIGLFRITNRRPLDVVSREFATEAGVRSVQPNFRYLLQDQLPQAQKMVLTEGDPAQYALAKLRLPEAHTLAHGANIIVAVIDSGIDTGHPELANSIADSFDALGSKESPHVHGTGVAGAIVAHARLMGSAPAAKILAIRAFGVAAGGVESTSYVILKALDYAAAHGAQIINMSFAGSQDALIDRGIAATAAKGIVMVAAGGNGGAKSPPLYPAANANVIAVSATDPQDRLFEASNRGNYIAVAAPGVDVFLPAPGSKYQMTSGTSFAAAFISGIGALLLERNSALKPDEVRTLLTRTARDLGAPGRDDLFGAGEADAFAAVSAATVPVAAVSDAPAAGKPGEPQDTTKAAITPAAVAAEKSTDGAPNRPSAQ